MDKRAGDESLARSPKALTSQQAFKAFDIAMAFFLGALVHGGNRQTVQ